jgi:hypothetical protein
MPIPGTAWIPCQVYPRILIPALSPIELDPSHDRVQSGPGIRARDLAEVSGLNRIAI